jgi:hypothetical protein
MLKFQTEWHNDKMTEWQNGRQDKNNIPPIFDHKGIRIVKININKGNALFN